MSGTPKVKPIDSCAWADYLQQLYARGGAVFAATGFHHPAARQFEVQPDRPLTLNEAVVYSGLTITIYPEPA